MFKIQGVVDTNYPEILKMILYLRLQEKYFTDFDLCTEFLWITISLSLHCEVKICAENILSLFVSTSMTFCLLKFLTVLN